MTGNRVSRRLLRTFRSSRFWVGAGLAGALFLADQSGCVVDKVLDADGLEIELTDSECRIPGQETELGQAPTAYVAVFDITGNARKHWKHGKNPSAFGDSIGRAVVRLEEQTRGEAEGGARPGAGDLLYVGTSGLEGKACLWGHGSSGRKCYVEDLVTLHRGPLVVSEDGWGDLSQAVSEDELAAVLREASQSVLDFQGDGRLTHTVPQVVPFAVLSELAQASASLDGGLSRVVMLRMDDGNRTPGVKNSALTDRAVRFQEHGMGAQSFFDEIAQYQDYVSSLQQLHEQGGPTWETRIQRIGLDSGSGKPDGSGEPVLAVMDAHFLPRAREGMNDLSLRWRVEDPERAGAAAETLEFDLPDLNTEAYSSLEPITGRAYYRLGDGPWRDMPDEGEDRRVCLSAGAWEQLEDPTVYVTWEVGFEVESAAGADAGVLRFRNWIVTDASLSDPAWSPAVQQVREATEDYWAFQSWPRKAVFLALLLSVALAFWPVIEPDPVIVGRMELVSKTLGATEAKQDAWYEVGYLRLEPKPGSWWSVYMRLPLLRLIAQRIDLGRLGFVFEEPSASAAGGQVRTVSHHALVRSDAAASQEPLVSGKHAPSMGESLVLKARLKDLALPHPSTWGAGGGAVSFLPAVRLSAWLGAAVLELEKDI